MYSVNIGDKILYYPANSDFAIYDTKLTQEVGIAGEFSFKVPPQNPYYSNLTQGALITIYKDNVEFWRGEIKEISYDFNKIADVYCIEDLAFLADEYLPPAQITNESYGQRFQAAIDAYNYNRPQERRFAAGYVTNVDNTLLCPWSTEYEASILDDLRDFICQDTGYIRVRRVTSGGSVTRYIDIVRLADYGVMATQAIEYASNLLDYVKDSNLEDLVNVLTPYGAELDSEVYDGYSERLEGTTIQNNQSINVYGRHEKAIVFDKLNKLEDLNAKAAEYLTQYSQPQLTMEVDAVDLSTVDNVDEIKIGDSVRIVSAPYAVDQWLYLTKLTRDLQNIAKNRLELSGTVQTGKTLTSQSLKTAEALSALPSKSSLLDAARKNAFEILNGVDGGYVTFDTNEDDQITELRIANNLDYAQATKCWRWNLNGLAYLSRETPADDWGVVTAATMDGGFVADFITSGHMSCDRLDGGVINGQNIYGCTIRSYYDNNENNGHVEIRGGQCHVYATANNFFAVYHKAVPTKIYLTIGPEITVQDTQNDNVRFQHPLRFLGYAVEDAFNAHASDISIKKNISDIPIGDSINVIRSARPRYYEFKKTHEPGIRSGFVAQELREALDDVGNDTAIERESKRRAGEREVIYEDFIAHLVNTTKDLYAEVAALKEEINKMKGVKNG